MNDDVRKHRPVQQQEPGRRHAAARVRTPRAGSDFYVPHRRNGIAKPIHVAEVTPTAPSQASSRTVNTLKPAAERTKRSMVLRRQMVERAEIVREQKKSDRKKHFFVGILVLILLSALAVVGWSFKDTVPITSNLFTKEPKVVRSVDSDPEEISSLDETTASTEQIAAHTVAPNAPKTITIPGIGVLARISKVGTTLAEEPISPKNIFEVGWYEPSGELGQKNAVLLNGHVAGPTKLGVFDKLIMLKTGDAIRIESGDGRILAYEVVRVQEYSSGEIDMKAATNSIYPTRKGLNLVTSTTKFSGSRKRVIVFALQLP